MIWSQPIKYFAVFRMLVTWFYTCKTEDMKGTCGHLLTRKPSSLDKQWDLPNVNESELRSRPGNSVPRCSPLVRSRVNEVTVDRRKKKQTNTNGAGLTTYGGFRVQTAIGPRDRELVKDIKIYITWFDWLWDYLIVYSSKPFNILPQTYFLCRNTRLPLRSLQLQRTAHWSTGACLAPTL